MVKLHEIRKNRGILKYYLSLENGERVTGIVRGW